VNIPEKVDHKHVCSQRPRSWVGPKFGVGEGDTLSNFDKLIAIRQSLMVASLVYTTKIPPSAWK